MFKKIGIYVDVRLRRAMDRSDGALGIISPGFSRCMELTKMIVDTAYCASGEDGESYLENINAVAIKYFDGGHAESGWLREAVKSAERLQFIVRKGHCEDRTFELHFFAFRAGSKEAFYEQEFYVSFLGEISTSGSAHMSG